MTPEERVADFARTHFDVYSSYHAHKEAMAYGGLTIFAAVVGAVIINENWPPKVWGSYSRTIALFAITVLWAAVLAFLRFQLRNRRWAALRMAGCEHILAMWASSQLKPEHCEPAHRKSASHRPLSVRVIDFLLWPLKDGVRGIQSPKNDSEPALYPAIVVTEWETQEQRGTNALRNERVLHAIAWLGYASLMIRTWTT